MRIDAAIALVLSAMAAVEAVRSRSDAERVRLWLKLAVIGGLAGLLDVVTASATPTAFLAVVAIAIAAGPAIFDRRAAGTSRTEARRFILWSAAIAILSCAAAVVASGEDEAATASAVASRWISGWNLAFVVGLAVLSLFGGFFVLRSSAAWTVAIGWPLLAAVMSVAITSGTLEVIGRPRADGLPVCRQTNSCGQVVAFANSVVITSPVVTAGPFIVVFALRRLIRRTSLSRRWTT